MTFRDRLQAQRLWTKFILFALALSIVPGICIGLLLSNVAQRTMGSILARDYHELAQQCAHDISLFLNDAQQIMRLYTRLSGQAFGQPEQLQWLLNEMVLETSLFETVHLFDVQGQAIVTTTFDGRRVPPRIQALLSRAPGAGDHLLSGVYFSDTGIPRVLMGLPVVWQNQSRGTLVGEINLFHLWQVVDRLRVGKTGFVAVLTIDENKRNASGQSARVFIAHPDKARILESFALPEDSGHVITASAEVPDVGWTVVVQQDAEEAYHFVRLMRWLMGSLIVFVTGGAIALAYWLTRPPLRALRALLSSTVRVAGGDFGHPLDVRTNDELGQLAGAFNRMMGALREAQTMERQLVQSQKMAEMSRVVANLAHELRNPLNNVATALLRLEHVELLDVPPDSAIRTCVRKISQNLGRSKHLISTLLEFAHQAKEPVRPVDVAALLDLLVDLLESEIRKRRIQVVKEYSPALPQVRARIELLKQAFLNVLSNAVEAMPGGGVLSLGLFAQGDNLILTVTDTGQGIPEQTGDEIFLPFITTKEPGEGTGLGLAIAYSNIQKHGGRISFSSRAGAGTTFTITLPVENSLGVQSLPAYPTDPEWSPSSTTSAKAIA